MANDLISVIIPVYNAEQYLRKCVHSVCQQTYQNLEIICIDDGSIDDSGAILEEMAAHDSRIRVLSQVNYGESHARNQGLAIAQGNWLAFVDNDDWLEPEMYEDLLCAGLSHGADMSCCSWIKEEGGHTASAVNFLPVRAAAFSREELLRYIYQRDAYQGFAYMWNKLYRKELFAGVRFAEDLRIGGDVLALAEAALRTRRACYTDVAYYHYLQRRDSGCHTNDLSALLDWVTAYDRVLVRFAQEQVSEEIMGLVKRFYAYTAQRVAKAAKVAGDSAMFRKATAGMRLYQAEYEAGNREHPEWIKDFRRTLEWEVET